MAGAWQRGSLAVALLGIGSYWAAPWLLVASLPVALRIAWVISRASEWEPRRIIQLSKEFAALVWGNVLLLPTAFRVVHYYHSGGGGMIAKDVDFGSPHNGGRNRLDVHFDPSAPHGTSPVVVFVFGGAWSSGDKAMYALVGRTLISHRVVTVIPNYSLYPNGSMADMVEDLAYALDWTAAHIAAYGGDPTRLHLVGHSAGGHLATSVVLRRWCAENGGGVPPAIAPPPTTLASLPPPPITLLPRLRPLRPAVSPQRRPLPSGLRWTLEHIRAVVTLCAPFDILVHYGFERRRGVHLLSGMLPAAHGDPEAHSCLHLVEHIATLRHPNVTVVPPIHVLHSDTDTVVPIAQAERFRRACHDAGIRCTPHVVVVPGTHSTPVEDLMAPHPSMGTPNATLPYLADIVGFT